MERSEEEKKHTESLYHETDALNKELSFLSVYAFDCGLDIHPISEIKKCLHSNAIDIAILKIEAVKQFVRLHHEKLVVQGMHPDFVDQLVGYENRLIEKHALHDALINTHRILSDDENEQYEILCQMISKIANAGKLVFENDTIQEEYIIKNVIARLRTKKQKDTVMA
jgi:hypothetical protein